MTRTSSINRLRIRLRDWRWWAIDRRRIYKRLWRVRFRSRHDWLYFLATGRFSWSKNGRIVTPAPGTLPESNVDELLDGDAAWVSQWRALLDRELSESEKSHSVVWQYVNHFPPPFRVPYE